MRVFEDGEHKARPLADVRGRDAFVVHSLYGDADQSPHDKLCRLLFLIGGAEAIFGVLSRTVVTDTIPPFRLDPAVARQKLVVLSVAPLLAGAIHAIHTDGSVANRLGD